MPLDLIAAGTSLATAALAPGVAGAGALEVAEEDDVELDDELLLPHAAIAATASSDMGTASQPLSERIRNSFPRKTGPAYARTVAVTVSLTARQHSLPAARPQPAPGLL